MGGIFFAGYTHSVLDAIRPVGYAYESVSRILRVHTCSRGFERTHEWAELYARCIGSESVFLHEASARNGHCLKWLFPCRSYLPNCFEPNAEPIVARFWLVGSHSWVHHACHKHHCLHHHQFTCTTPEGRLIISSWSMEEPILYNSEYWAFSRNVGHIRSFLLYSWVRNLSGNRNRSVRLPYWDFEHRITVWTTARWCNVQ